MDCFIIFSVKESYVSFSCLINASQYEEKINFIEFSEQMMKLCDSV